MTCKLTTRVFATRVFAIRVFATRVTGTRFLLTHYKPLKSNKDTNKYSHGKVEQTTANVCKNKTFKSDQIDNL